MLLKSYGGYVWLFLKYCLWRTKDLLCWETSVCYLKITLQDLLFHFKGYNMTIFLTPLRKLGRRKGVLEGSWNGAGPLIKTLFTFSSAVVAFIWLHSDFLYSEECFPMIERIYSQTYFRALDFLANLEVKTQALTTLL